MHRILWRKTQVDKNKTLWTEPEITEITRNNRNKLFKQFNSAY